jgi:SAM-dependent MidA family methyltransferase
MKNDQKARREKSKPDSTEELKRKEKEEYKKRFPDVDPGMIDWTVDYSFEKDPHHNSLKGYGTAQETLARNRITDSRTVESVLKIGINYRDFQELNLYHKNGFFEQKNEFSDEGMLLLPQILSPMMGKIFGELMFACSTKVVHDISFGTSAPETTFLGLGAGAGYLDFDLINHINSPMFDLNEYQHVIESFKKAKFIISDRTEKSLELLAKELAELQSRPELRDRIALQQIDALDFDLGGLPFGAVYFNELIDNMPTEPIVKIEGNLYCVKLVPYCLNGEGENSQDAETLNIILGLKGVISQDNFRERVEQRDTSNIRFAPVFIPLSYDHELVQAVSDTPCVKNIDNENFGGVYPIHMSLDPLFKSVKKSFQNGVLMSVDYCSYGGGMHNWNKSVNIFRFLEFGKEDLDFQLDSEQVISKAKEHGMVPEINRGLGSFLECYQDWIPRFSKKDFERWSKLNPGVENSGFLKKGGGNMIDMVGGLMGIPNAESMGAYFLNYKFISGFAKRYDTLVFGF